MICIYLWLRIHQTGTGRCRTLLGLAPNRLGCFKTRARAAPRCDLEDMSSELEYEVHGKFKMTDDGRGFPDTY